jgi:hypothetical protein
LISQLHDPLGGGGMHWRTCATHGDPGATELLADCGLGEV